MRILYLPANEAYCILLDNNKDASLIDIDGKRLFKSKRELREYLKPHGLGLKQGGWIVPLEKVEGGGQLG